MKSLRLLLCALPLALTGCSTMSSVNWSAAYPWNWFGSSMEVSEQGVGNLTASTALSEQAIGDALGSSYRLCSGMKTANGNIVRYFEALKDDKVALTINGEAFGNCQKGSNDNGAVVECKAEGSQHISYAFTGSWSGPEELMPSDDTLKNWKVSKIIWRR